MPYQPVLHHITGEFRSRWRGRIHAIATCAALPAGAALIVLANGTLATTATSIYVASLVLLFGTSASYHILARSRRAQLIMQRLDHAIDAGSAIPQVTGDGCDHGLLHPPPCGDGAWG